MLSSSLRNKVIEKVVTKLYTMLKSLVDEISELKLGSPSTSDLTSPKSKSNSSTVDKGSKNSFEYEILTKVQCEMPTPETPPQETNAQNYFQKALGKKITHSLSSQRQQCDSRSSSNSKQSCGRSTLMTSKNGSKIKYLQRSGNK
mmetsp:Transcript_15798/g.18279  ORF Transcript_15798/g.18279 Transcript_15798/m.18279 type:complete len:145 (+) Transcript_15798:321-755(+)